MLKFRERSSQETAVTDDDNFMVAKTDSSSFMASLPWVDTIEALTPTEYENAKPTAKYAACLCVIIAPWLKGVFMQRPRCLPTAGVDSRV